MNRFKFNAFVEEFPFLSELIPDSPIDCDSIKIKRATKELMGHKPYYRGATGSLVGINDDEDVSFILNDGTIIEDAVQSELSVTHNEAHRDNEYKDGETVLEAIDRHSVTDTLKYIVSHEYGYNIESHYSQPNFRVTIFKPSREFNWVTLIVAAQRKALEEVQAEANF
jgi:hypothetical protein